jgi:hypothetical protein
MSDIELNLEIEEPINLNLEIESPIELGAVQSGLAVGPQGPVGTGLPVTSGEKVTGVHAGVLGTISITDDYMYLCVKEGEAGVAIWKKSLLFQSL